MIKAGIVGGSGFVAGELLRCLVHHPEVEVAFVYSHSKAGTKVSEIHQDLFESSLALTDEIDEAVDVVFLCLGHGNSARFLKQNKFSDQTKIIDLSNDFRLEEDSHFEGRDFVYGLPELNGNSIVTAKNIANPGCFASAIQLGLLPLANSKLIKNDVHINAITGSTGAGGGLSATTHFSWRNTNVSVYKAFEHQHISEITESLMQCQSDFNRDLNFLPVRGNFTRGIFATSYTDCNLDEQALVKIYEDFYSEAVFTHVTTKPIHLKQVVNTNNCLIQVQKIKNKVLVTSLIDNLLKGAAGQAIQNMNILFGLPETTGLGFKANYF